MPKTLGFAVNTGILIMLINLTPRELNKLQPVICDNSASPTGQDLILLYNQY